MTAVTSPEVLADPVGVIVGLVAGREPALDRAVIARVAAGRGGRPGQAAPAGPGPRSDGRRVLADGRSPAPRVVGDLLIALRKAGAA